MDGIDRLSEDPADYEVFDPGLGALLLESASLLNMVSDCLESGEFGELPGLWELICAAENRIQWSKDRAGAERRLNELLGD